MRKIPTVFERVFKDHKVVYVESVFTNVDCVNALVNISQKRN